MSKVTLDCRGLTCPQPVLNCKQTIEEQRPQVMVIKVDNQAAAENVTRFLGSQDYAVTRAKEGDLLVLTAKDLASPGHCPAREDLLQEAEKSSEQLLVFISSETLGVGDVALGKKLMKNFIATLPEMGKNLWRIILVNGGVKLASTGSPVLKELQSLSAKGVSILVCGTCLEHFDLLAEKQVGETTNMLDVVTSLQVASKVIKV